MCIRNVTDGKQCSIIVRSEQLSFLLAVYPNMDTARPINLYSGVVLLLADSCENIVVNRIIDNLMITKIIITCKHEVILLMVRYLKRKPLI